MSGEIVLNQSAKKVLKILVIVIIAAAVLSGIGVLVWNLVPKEQDRVEVFNQDELDLSGHSFDEFRLYLLGLLEREGYINEGDKVDDVTIREGSVSSFTEKYDNGNIMKTTSFLIDIDSLKQTFRVEVYDYTGNLSDMPVTVKCPDANETKYPDSECKGVYGSSSKSIRNNLPYETKLETGEKVLVKKIEATKDGKQLVQVYLYSCDEKNPPIEMAETAVKKWTEEVGDPELDSYTYNIRTGYCEGDAI